LQQAADAAKGIYDFIELSKMHPEMRGFGRGGFPAGPFSKDRLKIERMKKKCGDNVIFTGFIPTSRKLTAAQTYF